MRDHATYPSNFLTYLLLLKGAFSFDSESDVDDPEGILTWVLPLQPHAHAGRGEQLSREIRAAITCTSIYLDSAEAVNQRRFSSTLICRWRFWSQIQEEVDDNSRKNSART